MADLERRDGWHRHAGCSLDPACHPGGPPLTGRFLEPQLFTATRATRLDCRRPMSHLYLRRCRLGLECQNVLLGGLP